MALGTQLIENSLRAMRSLATGRIRMQFDRIPLEYERVARRKLLNWLRVETSMLVRPVIPWGQPTHLQVEPSSLCNLRCPACRVVTGLGRKGSLMELDLFKKIVDEARENVFLIALWGWGEPFLNPAIYDMITYAKWHGIRLIASTNGHFLKGQDEAEQLIRAGLDALIVAVDGSTQETYELYRRPGTLDSVLEGVRALAERKRCLQSELPLINFRAVVSRQNEHEIPDMVELARSCGVNMFSLKTLNPLSSDPYSLDPTPEDDSDDPFVPTNPHYQRFRYRAGGNIRIRVSRNPCKRLWNNPKILSDGTVVMCTCDVAGSLPLGNVNTESLRQIWMSADYRQKRKQFHADWEKMAPCCTCTYGYQGGSCIDEIISDVVFFDPEGSVPSREKGRPQRSRRSRTQAGPTGIL
jgi:radical SAM protein with 4Fe4S-binding SPASM domain